MDFFDRFPEGTYRIEAKSLDGPKQKGTPEVTHLMPAPAGGITLNAVLDSPIQQERCDEDDPMFAPTLVPISADGTVTIDWVPVTMSHPDPNTGGAGVQPPEPVDIVTYQLVVEVETASEQEVEISVILPPSETSVEVQAAYIALDDDGQIKYEILAREESFNQTAVESCFCIIGADCSL